MIVDCGALPENLLEAELFGHRTGRVHRRGRRRGPGAIEAADGGTVFLDEIGELPLSMQPKLLRVLESRTVRRVGETAQRTVNVRFLSATNRDLRTMVNTGAFREDLYFRLAVLPVTIPPLRERPEDILALVQHFLPREALAAVTPQMMRELTGRPWLGNVRELRNFVERALALGAHEALALSAPPAAAAGDAIPLPPGPAGPALQGDARARRCWRPSATTSGAAGPPRPRRVRGRRGGRLNRTYLYRLVAKHQPVTASGARPITGR